MIHVSTKRFLYNKLCPCDGNCLFLFLRNQSINKGSMYHIVNKLTTFSLHIQHINILWIKYSEFLPDPLQNGSYCFFKHQTPMGLRVFRCCCFFFNYNSHLERFFIYFIIKLDCSMVPIDYYNFNKFITL